MAAFIHDRIRRELEAAGIPMHGIADEAIDQFVAAYDPGSTHESVLRRIHDDLGGHREARSTNDGLPPLPNEGAGEDGAGETEDGRQWW